MDRRGVGLPAVTVDAWAVSWRDIQQFSGSIGAVESVDRGGSVWETGDVNIDTIDLWSLSRCLSELKC